MSFQGRFGRAVCTLLVLVSPSACLARASATLLVEEPYGTMGFFTATGHAAVYLTGVCAETPVVLRKCSPGELGAVISRYNAVHGYDWLAVPLIPYLYAVDRPEDVPLFADPKMVSFLRDQYRRKYLEEVAPDANNGAMPGGNWYELVGSAYDRAAYGFEIETSQAQDEAFIQTYNAAPNRSHFHLSYRNCADFTKDVINFYYPKSLHRSIVADMGITTPKQMAKTLIKFSGKRSELQFSRFVIPQIPGSAARSTPVHGVVESFLKSKKYIVPTVVVNPVLAGCVLAVYEGTGAGRFDPARKALVFSPERGLEAPVGPEDRRSYQSELNHLVADPATEAGGVRGEKFGRLLRSGVPDFDAEGRPILRIQVGADTMAVGVAGSNILVNDDAGLFTQQLLEARLHAELKRGAAPKVSESDMARDWSLLQEAREEAKQEFRNGAYAEVATRTRRPQQSASQAPAGNRP
jgi:hypothetical protein